MKLLHFASVFIAVLLANKSCGYDPSEMGMLFPRESESRQIKELGGLWLFRADMSTNRKAGFDEKWYTRALDQSGPVISMAVPSSFNDVTQDDSLRTFVGWVWYECTVFVHNSWKNEDLRVVLRFESAHYNTMVWVNGKQAMTHSGGHLPFEAEVNNLLMFGVANRITVAVNNTLTPTTLPPGDIQYKTGPRYPSGYFVQTYQFDFFNYAGIHRLVRFYTTPKLYISDISVVPNLTAKGEGNLEFKSLIVIPQSYHKGNVSLTVKYQLYDKLGEVVASMSGAELYSGVLNVLHVKPWWPIGMSDSPGYLYNLKEM